MMDERDLRQRIEVLRFVLVAGLVLLHYGAFPGSDLSPFRGFQPSAHPVATFVNAFVLFFFLSAVPLLSAISGWLFFKDFRHAPLFYMARVRARAKSVLLPMVLWNLMVLAAFVAASVFTSDPRILGIIAYDVANLTVTDVANALFGITRHPVNFQFWFLRDLFLTILVSPLLGLALRHAPVVGAVLLGMVWFFGFDLWIFFRTDVLFFFYMGGLLQVRRTDVTRPAPRLGLALLGLFVLLAAARTIGPYGVAEDSPLGVVLFDYGSRLMRAVGVVALWLVSPVILSFPIGQAMARLGAVAFFLHAFHWPVNQFIKHALDLLLPAGGDAVMLFNYTATALLTVLLTVFVARRLNRIWPSFYDVLSGGRAQGLSTRRQAVPTA